MSLNKSVNKQVSSVKSVSRKINSNERSFTINNVYHVDGCPTKFTHNDYTGRYEGKDARSAASKALTKLCAVKKIRGRCTLYIEMRETTQGSPHNLFAYHCKRIHLKIPHEVNGHIHYYTNKVKAVDIPTEKCAKSHKSSGRMIGYHSKLRSHPHKQPKSKSKTMSLTKKISNSISSIGKSVKRIFSSSKK